MGQKPEIHNLPVYGVDSDSQLARAFPQDVAPPQLLLDFVSWLRGKPWGAVGCFDLTAAEQVDKLLPLEAEENNNFAMCIWLPDGGLAGFWFKDTRDAMQAPFVHLDSEGQFSVLAPNFALFLRRLADARFDGYKASSDFLPRAFDADDDDAPPDLTGELSVWLETHSLASKTIADASQFDLTYEDDGQAQLWLNRLCSDIEDAKKTDPNMVALAKVVQLYQLHQAGKGPQWSVESYRIFAVADIMVIRRGALLLACADVDKRLTKIAPEAEAALKPILFALREALAKSKKGLGLWPSATLSILNSGEIDIQPNFDHEFAIGLEGFDAQGFIADQARYPRKTSKLAVWHAALIENKDKD